MAGGGTSVQSLDSSALSSIVINQPDGWLL
jgi:hypothetical protein